MQKMNKTEQKSETRMPTDLRVDISLFRKLFLNSALNLVNTDHFVLLVN